jgi:O-antigen ligase
MSVALTKIPTALQHNFTLVLLALSLGIGTIAGNSMALWGIGGAVVFFFLASLAEQRWLWPNRFWLILVMAFFMLALSAQFQALDPARSWHMIGRMATILLPLLCFSVPLSNKHHSPAPTAAASPSLPRLAIILFVCALLLLLGEMVTNGLILLPIHQGKGESLTYYNRGLSYAALLLWPLIALTHRQYRTVAILVPLLLLVATLSPSRGAVLAIIGSTGFWLLTRLAPRLVLPAALVLLTIVAIIAPLSPSLIFAHSTDWLQQIPPSWRHRFEIWDFVWQRSLTAPMGGLGLDSVGLLPPLSPHQGLYLYANTPAAHPHQMFLQLYLELGLLGWLWGVILALAALWQTPQLPHKIRAAATAVWAGALILACGAFSLWTDSFWATLAVTMFLLRVALTQMHQRDQKVYLTPETRKS